jgi:hypothetical protein
MAVIIYGDSTVRIPIWPASGLGLLGRLGITEVEWPAPAVCLIFTADHLYTDILI